ncbi:MAG: hypothetical protein ABSA44_09190 [Bacteroidota bacterium]|jgi:hypothetical protein
MTSVEQRKMVQRLKHVMTKMSSDERQSFEMMLKRDHDDEELDSLTMAKLKQLHAKFFPKNSKQALEDKWKKLTGEEN